MTILDNVAWAIGAAFIATACITIILGLIWFVLDVPGRAVWGRLTALYELSTLHWWLNKIKASGHTIPTKQNVAALLSNGDDK